MASKSASKKSARETTGAVRRRAAGEIRSFNTHLETPLLKRLRLYAAEHDLAISAVVTQALQAYLGGPA